MRRFQERLVCEWFTHQPIKAMKTNLRVTMAALGVAVLNLGAQGASELNIQTYAGLTIVGEIGKVYSIEYVTDLTDPAESDWRCLEYL